jgi:hypothetical protein
VSDLLGAFAVVQEDHAFHLQMVQAELDRLAAAGADGAGSRWRGREAELAAHVQWRTKWRDKLLGECAALEAARVALTRDLDRENGGAR